MENTAERAIAIVGLGAVLPDAPDVAAFWKNIKAGRYSISEVTPDRWDPELYYDSDPTAPDKSYSKIGGWVRDYAWEPMKWRMAIPPRVVDAMDASQKWAIVCTRQALEDYGYPNRPLDTNRTAVILGNAMGGEMHYLTSFRAYFPEYERELSESASFAALPEAVRRDIKRELHARIGKHLPEITEDSMPGELANCIAGRIANLFNFHGPNYTTDAACASTMAALSSAVKGLIERDFDVVVTGGIDTNMGAPTFIKFCKIGALSATGSRPYAQGADGFVMGEGAAIFLMKRLADAERDGDKVYAVLRGIGGSSDGKGKGITAPNPIGQRLAVERGWQNAGLSPATVTLLEGHGTSTRVGDVVEVNSAVEVLSSFELPPASVALGSVKSNFGHLKGAAGAAGLLKAVLALHEKVLPPSVNGQHPNPEIDFAHSPLYVNTELKPWTIADGQTRRAGLSAFGFGGTNFHAVIEEYVPQKLNGNGKRSVAVGEVPHVPTAGFAAKQNAAVTNVTESYKAPLRGAAVIGAESPAVLTDRLRSLLAQAEADRVPPPSAPLDSDLRAPERIAIDYADAKELAGKCAAGLKALAANQPAVWKALRAQGIFRGTGPAGKVAFLYTGQGSQYVNMLKSLRAAEPIVAETFAEADRVMTPLLGKPLSDFIFVDSQDAKAVERAENDLMQTAITQPAVLATDLALTHMLAAYGIEPDFTMGHSLGEYGALVAAGGLPFADALEAVSARGREMTRVSMDDNGRMAAVFAPIEEIEQLLKKVDGYVVIANINSEHQAVIGGASRAVEQAMEIFQQAGYEVAALPVSHAFHTSIVAPASGPLRQVLQRLRLQSPRLPIVTNVDGEFYPTGANVVPLMLDTLAKQIASPVQFIKGLRTLYAAGARVFVEVGPKKALHGFAEDVLGKPGDVLPLFTNHPKSGDVVSFNQALCGLYAAGLGRGITAHAAVTEQVAVSSIPVTTAARFEASAPNRFKGEAATGNSPAEPVFASVVPSEPLNTNVAFAPVVITGAALGLPGTEHVFDDSNVARILRGDQFIGLIPTRLRQAMVDKHITRLVKSDNGGPVFETINDVAEVIKLAGRGSALDLEKEFGVPADRVLALDRATMLAIASGIEALRDAGIPLVMRYKTTSKGTQLPDRWCLPETMRNDTGVIFASAFPGYNSFAEILSHYHIDRGRREQVALLEDIRHNLDGSNGQSTLLQQVERTIGELKKQLEAEPFLFDRRFLFRVLAMGHSQFAEYIGARGPNTQINGACASTPQAVALAEDWIRAGRCRRVVVISADDVTSDNLMDWMGAGFLASGAAATDEVVENAALPFDRRRHGMLIGMGAAAVVVESAEAARERGMRPICEVLSAVVANSAFHGTRLDVQHISQVMEDLVARAEKHSGISRREIAPKTVFVSHETYTPARGGSASAEIYALRNVFGDAADQIVIANTKGFTGHAMATGIEDVVAVKALETGCVPPVPNFQEIDPELGALNLSKGGKYPVEYALRLGAGFGSQISMTLLRYVPSSDGVRRAPDALGYSYRIADQQVWSRWLANMAGPHAPELEVAHHTLRIRNERLTAQEPQQVQVGMAAAAAAQPSPAPTPVVVPSTPAPASPVTAAVSVPTAMKTADASIATSSQQGDSVKDRVLALVSAKTGYPVDMLDLDLDLEADLGVDTVKQAEVFASIRETYGIARDENVKLRDFPTLAHVIGFVHDKRPDLRGESATIPPTATTVTQEKVIAPELVNVLQPTAVASENADVKARIVALVVEKTGYPEEMLDLDLDLEADLGVDTVKQAEMFAAIREIYNIPRDENRKLRDYPTLAHVIRFVYENRPDLSGATQPPSASTRTTAVAPENKPVTQEPATVPAQTTQRDDVKARILALVVEKTGYPEEMLDLDLDLEADLGVDTVKQAEMVAAIREIYNIPRDENRKLRDYPTLAHVIRFVYENRPDLAGATQPSPTTTQLEPVAAAPISSDSVREKILEIVAEKTGYPKEMLDLDLDLEADLGIDTVKQAEMFAAVRAAYNIPRDENLKLRDFPTLAHVIQFAMDRRPSGAVRSASVANTDEQNKPATSVSAPPPAAKPSPPIASFEAAEKIPRRVPVPAPRPSLAVCKPTGVMLAGGRRVLIMPDAGGVAEQLRTKLESSGVEVLWAQPTADADAITEQLKSWMAAGPVHGVYWLPALDYEGPVQNLDLATWRESLRRRVKLLYATMRVLYDQIALAGTFLVSATRLRGQHGYDEAGAVAPLGGAVTGFTKAYKRERNESLVKTVDFTVDQSPVEIADTLVQETLRDPGVVEVGYKQGQRWTIALEEQPAADGLPGLMLNSNTVFVITGAAGSIVSAITADLASASGGTFYLVDVVPKPDPQNPDLKKFVSDKDNLKRELFARIQARGERATPAAVERELATLERAVAAQTAIDAVQAAGGTAHYFSANLADADAIANVIHEVRQRSGRIDVLLHAAGIERSHFLPEKDPREFDLVFDVKCDGFFNLLHAIGDMTLGATVVFSSVAGRFGNGGQTDYSSANDLLCKLTSSFRTYRPDTRAIAIDWTAWGGIGMATRGSIPKMMEVAGIDMLPPEAGVPLIRRELTTGGTRGEIVVAQRLGILLKEWDPTGGIDFSALSRSATGPMLGTVAGTSESIDITSEVRLDPGVQPFLYDHQIDGTPLLPGVMGVEALAEAAACLFPKGRIAAIENVDFLSPFKFYRNEPRTVTVRTHTYSRDNNVLADCQLIGSRTLPNRKEPQLTTHFTGRVRLTGEAPEPVTTRPLGKLEGQVIDAQTIYRAYFHGPAYRVLAHAWWDGLRIIGLLADSLPPNHHPAELKTLMAPRLIELCFQTAGLWELGVQGRMGLPQHFDEVRLERSPELATGRLYAVVTPDATRGGFDTDVIDEAGSRYLYLGGYRTVPLPAGVDTDALRELQAIMSPEVVKA
jgi:acyl transferase domain-containing protein/NAD(P)-dependent dehydrogenase (short-subunit alcohol dehydrogenase family)/acyl carrier protein